MRWVLAFWPGTAASSPAGTCPEEQHHIEPRVTCTSVQVTSVGRVLHLGAVDEAAFYAAKVLDAGPAGVDEAGFMKVPSIGDATCGAGQVPTSPISQGSLTVLP